MKKQQYIEPQFEQQHFTCPSCGKNSNQIFRKICVIEENEDQKIDLFTSECKNCKHVAFWLVKYKRVIAERDITGQTFYDWEFNESSILYPYYKNNNITIPEFMKPNASREYFKKAVELLDVDLRCSMMYLRLCFEEMLKTKYNEPSSNLGNLIKKLNSDPEFTNNKFIKVLFNINTFLSDGQHTTNLIDFSKPKPLKNDILLVMELLGKCAEDIFGTETILNNFKQKYPKKEKQNKN